MASRIQFLGRKWRSDDSLARDPASEIIVDAIKCYLRNGVHGSGPCEEISEKIADVKEHVTSSELSE